MDKTLKMRAYSAASETSNLTREQELELELMKKNTQLEEEKKKALDTLTALEQQREATKREQAKAAEVLARLAAAEARIKELGAALETIAAAAVAASTGKRSR